MRPQISEGTKLFSLYFLMFNMFIFYGLCGTQLLKAGYLDAPQISDEAKPFFFVFLNV